MMRTTLAIDDDVLEAARAMAERERRTVGQIVSDLARQGLKRPEPVFKTRNGVPLLPTEGRTGVVTLELVNALRDEAP
jgi:hypothetical protein